MKHVSMEMQGLALGLSLLGALVPFSYGANLTEQCTEQLGGDTIKVVFVVRQYDNKDANVEYYFPYDVKPYSVKFPLKVTDIARPPEVITLVPYHASPVKYMVCWWSGGVYKCV